VVRGVRPGRARQDLRCVTARPSWQCRCDGKRCVIDAERTLLECTHRVEKITGQVGPFDPRRSAGVGPFWNGRTREDPSWHGIISSLRLT
jgi:hypothetical protein